MAKKSAKKSKKIIPETNSNKPLANTPIKKSNAGRPKEPVSGKVDYAQLLILCTKGFTDKELAAFYKVSEVTINNWKKDEQFSLVLKEGKLLADSKVERALFERACGYKHKAVKMFCSEGSIVEGEYEEHYPPDPTSMIFWLKNRKPGEWKDKQEVEHSGQIKTISQTTNFSLKSKGK